jgi:hypothetical protein
VTNKTTVVNTLTAGDSIVLVVMIIGVVIVIDAVWNTTIVITFRFIIVAIIINTIITEKNMNGFYFIFI